MMKTLYKKKRKEKKKKDTKKRQGERVRDKERIIWHFFLLKTNWNASFPNNCKNVLHYKFRIQAPQHWLRSTCQHSGTVQCHVLKNRAIIAYGKIISFLFFHHQSTTYGQNKTKSHKYTKTILIHSPLNSSHKQNIYTYTEQPRTHFEKVVPSILPLRIKLCWPFHLISQYQVKNKSNTHFEKVVPSILPLHIKLCWPFHLISQYQVKNKPHTHFEKVVPSILPLHKKLCWPFHLICQCQLKNKK